MPKDCVFFKVGTELLNTEKNFRFNTVKWFYSSQYQQNLQTFFRWAHLKRDAVCFQNVTYCVSVFLCQRKKSHYKCCWYYSSTTSVKTCMYVTLYSL